MTPCESRTPPSTPANASQRSGGAGGERPRQWSVDSLGGVMSSGSASGNARFCCRAAIDLRAVPPPKPFTRFGAHGSIFTRSAVSRADTVRFHSSAPKPASASRVWSFSRPSIGPGGCWSGSKPSSTSKVRRAQASHAMRPPLSHGTAAPPGRLPVPEKFKRRLHELVCRRPALLAHSLAAKRPGNTRSSPGHSRCASNPSQCATSEVFPAPPQATSVTTCVPGSPNAASSWAGYLSRPMRCAGAWRAMRPVDSLKSAAVVGALIWPTGVAPAFLGGPTWGLA